ncbi:sodium channel and clathrin linker 1-like [Patiria miniata]|uniref:Sodium channel and clathrin linker 1 n=1 Tax=Patiria miniata TaxID=46514 RepID=A0A914A0B9_PATMI|nr:sodium channel and clathrin linker 1-like [Patiria miniata]
MEVGEREFLREQVQRVNAELQRYQEKYLPLDENEKASLHTTGDPPAPWLTSKNLLSPLIAEYDHQLSSLRKQINTYKAEHLELAGKIDKLVNENNRLHRELKAAIQGQLEAVHEVSRADHSIIEEQQLIDNLQKQITLTTQEKDSAVEMWQETVQELDRLAKEHRDLLNSSEAQSQRVQAIQEKGSTLMSQNQSLVTGNQKLEMASQHLQQVIASQSQELDSLRDHLKRARTDLRSANLQLAEMRTTTDKLKEDNQAKEREKQQAKGREESADSRLTQLQAVVMDLEHRLTNLSEENARMLATRKEQEDRMRSLHHKCGKAERREHEALAQVRDSIQMVENALLEKDQALVREQQKTQELGRLQEALSKLINEAGKRTRQEVDNVRKQCNTNIGKLMEEIQSLEMENAEKQAEIERAMREKRAVEQELETVYREGAKGPDDHLYQELQGRVNIAERMRSQAMVQVQKLEKAMQRMENSQEEEKSQSLLINEQLKQRLDKVGKECETVSEERLKLTEVVDDYKKRLLAAQKERAATERKSLSQMATVQQEMSQLRVEYDARLDSTELGNRQAMKEVRDMLTAQQRMSAKWREESKTLAQKFESKVSDLRSEIAMHKQRSEELTSQLSQQREMFLESERKQSEEADMIRKLNRKLADTELRAATATKKLSEQLAREKRLLHDRKHLQNELEKMKLEASRSNRLSDSVHFDLDRPDASLAASRTHNVRATMTLGQHYNLNGNNAAGSITGTGSHVSSVRSSRTSSLGSGNSTPEYLK